jgi:hypothetical protein
MCDILHVFDIIYLITIKSLLFIKTQIITNIQNIQQLNQCTLDTFRHGRWQHFQSPGVATNV